MKTTHEVIVIGAGPAGCAVSTILSQHGHDVLLVEKEKFPRYHIGESLVPETYWPLKRMGMIDRLKDSGFVRKYSVQFYNQHGKGSRPFYFDKANPHESSQTWQVKRSVFDQMLMQNARSHGVTVREETEVTDVRMEHECAVGVTARAGDGPAEELYARVIVDASGIHALLSRKLKMRKSDPALRKASVYTFYKGARRDTGKDEGATLILHTEGKKGWFWFIPLEDDISSVGVVAAPEELFGNGSSERLEILERQIALCAPIRERLAEAEQTGDVRACTDYSWRSNRVAGDGYVLVGDAFGFLDPVYSTGVYLALKSGEMAADCIHDALQENNVTAERLSRFGAELQNGMELFRKLVYAFYNEEFSFGRFLKDNPQFEIHIVDLLMGNVFRPGVEEVFDRMKDYIELPETGFLSPKQ